LTKTRKSSKSQELDAGALMENSDLYKEKCFLKDESTQADFRLKPTLNTEASVGDEVKFLRRMVQKLNVELSKGLGANCVDILDGEAPPSWLHDLRHLAPLILAFEEEVHFIIKK
jgi:hypothetical protein